MKTSGPDFSIRTKQTPAIRLGYVPLLDAAPLIVAKEKGLFRDAGLRVELSREVGWATIRYKLAFGNLAVSYTHLTLPTKA